MMLPYEDPVMVDPEVDRVICEADRIISDVLRYAQKLETEVGKHVAENEWVDRIADLGIHKVNSDFTPITPRRSRIDSLSIQFHGKWSGE